MNEEFLQFIWKTKLFKNHELHSTNGDQLEIIEIGKHNKDAGPDFFDARIKINEVLWAGNVEIHVKSSMWHQHKHHKDEAYNNVILHVVFENDVEVFLSDKRKLPCLILEFDEELFYTYKQLMDSAQWIPCHKEIKTVAHFFVKNWLDRMILERLERKAFEVKNILSLNKNSWEESFYQLISRYFGMKVNADPFQQLSQALPLKTLARQKNSLLQIEALLFGQAGMLSESLQDEYYQKLQREYLFLAGKYKLSPLPAHRWKWLRLRPGNFPTIRIAQLAALIHKSSSLFSKILESPKYENLTTLFHFQVSDYWNSHYRFAVKSKSRNKAPGKMMINSLLINSIVPILFCYGAETGKVHIKEKALQLLEEIPPENNSIIRKWKEAGIKAESAWHSQALLQLKENYCNPFKCLQCEFGNRIIRIKNHHFNTN